MHLFIHSLVHSCIQHPRVFILNQMWSWIVKWKNEHNSLSLPILGGRQAGNSKWSGVARSWESQPVEVMRTWKVSLGPKGWEESLMERWWGIPKTSTKICRIPRKQVGVSGWGTQSKKGGRSKLERQVIDTHKLVSRDVPPRLASRSLDVQKQQGCKFPEAVVQILQIAISHIFISNSLVSRKSHPNSLCLSAFNHEFYCSFLHVVKIKKKIGDLSFIENHEILFLWEHCSGQRDEKEIYLYICVCVCILICICIPQVLIVPGESKSKCMMIWSEHLNEQTSNSGKRIQESSRATVNY